MGWDGIGWGVRSAPCATVLSSATSSCGLQPAQLFWVWARGLPSSCAPSPGPFCARGSGLWGFPAVLEPLPDAFPSHHTHVPCRIHTGDRPYKCPHPGCEKAFTQLSNLQVSSARVAVGRGGAECQTPQGMKQGLLRAVPAPWPPNPALCRSLPVSPATAQQGQALQVPELLPGLHGLGLAADPPLSARHQARQGLLLQHVRPRLYLGEGAVGARRGAAPPGPPAHPPSLCPAGDVPDEAHVQTHRGGAPRQPALSSKDRIPRHPCADLAHLSGLRPAPLLPGGGTPRRPPLARPPSSRGLQVW